MPATLNGLYGDNLFDVLVAGRQLDPDDAFLALLDRAMKTGQISYINIIQVSTHAYMGRFDKGDVYLRHGPAHT